MNRTPQNSKICKTSGPKLCRFEGVSISFSRYWKPADLQRDWKGSPGINEFGKVPVFMLWNLHTHIPSNPTVELLRDSVHTRKFHVGGKPVKFIYRLPKYIKRYLDTKVLKDCDPDDEKYNDIGKYLSFVCGEGNFPAPNVFWGTVGLSLQGIDGSLVLGSVYPVKFLFTVETSVNVTCKGFSDLS